MAYESCVEFFSRPILEVTMVSNENCFNYFESLKDKHYFNFVLSKCQNK